MFNILKVTSFLHSFASPSAPAPHSHPDLAHLLATNPNQQPTPLPTIDKQDSKKTESKAKDSKKKDDDDSYNGGGGFLEPIIEDLQGFLQGRRGQAVLSL
jgi:hypothetical protein